MYQLYSMEYFPYINHIKRKTWNIFSTFSMFVIYITNMWKIGEGEMKGKQKFRHDPKLKLMDRVRNAKLI